MKDILQKFLNQVAKDIKDEQARQGRVASGKTAQSLEVEANDKTGILFGNISVNVLETGRKGGRVPSGFPAIILQWMKDKRIFQAETEARQKGIAWAIANRIKNEGTLLHREGGASGVLTKAINETAFQVLERNVLQKMGRELVGEVVTTFAK